MSDLQTINTESQSMAKVVTPGTYSGLSKFDKVKSKSKNLMKEHGKSILCGIIAFVLLIVVIYYLMQTIPDYQIAGGAAVGALLFAGGAYMLYKKECKDCQKVDGGAPKKTKKKSKKL